MFLFSVEGKGERGGQREEGVVVLVVSKDINHASVQEQVTIGTKIPLCYGLCFITLFVLVFSRKGGGERGGGQKEEWQDGVGCLERPRSAHSWP